MNLTLAIKEQIKKIPNKTGVYLFYNSENKVIYVGKATSLKNRVRSYFSSKKQVRLIESMIFEVKKIKIKTTDSVLEAIILEGDIIKRLQPKYNILWKDDKSWIYVLLTKNEYPQLKFLREHDLKTNNLSKYEYIFGPYPNLNTRALVKILRQLFSVSFCQPNSKRACLYKQMGDCLGVCTGEISPIAYQKKVIKPLLKFFTGKKDSLISSLNKEMQQQAIKKNFEEAGRLRDRLKAIKTINDLTLINQDFIKERFRDKSVIRFEGYDISNLGQTNKVGSMVVFDSKGPLKDQYKKFNIFTVTGVNDVASLAEIFSRRIKRVDWPWPDVVVVDGGRPQVNQAIKIFKQAKDPLPIIIGIAQGQKKLKNEFIFNKNDLSALNIVNNFNDLLLQIRDEAHRFALNFQKQKRKIKK